MGRRPIGHMHSVHAARQQRWRVVARLQKINAQGLDPRSTVVELLATRRPPMPMLERRAERLATQKAAAEQRIEELRTQAIQERLKWAAIVAQEAENAALMQLPERTPYVDGLLMELRLLFEKDPQAAHRAVGRWVELQKELEGLLARD